MALAPICGPAQTSQPDGGASAFAVKVGLAMYRDADWGWLCEHSNMPLEACRTMLGTMFMSQGSPRMGNSGVKGVRVTDLRLEDRGRSARVELEIEYEDPGALGEFVDFDLVRNENSRWLWDKLPDK